MRLGVIVNGDKVQVIDLATGEAVQDVFRAKVRSTRKGVTASMSWHVVASYGEAPEEPEDAPVVIGREAFLGAQLDRDDDDRPRPRRAL